MSDNIEQLKSMCIGFRKEDWTMGNIVTGQAFLIGLCNEVIQLETKLAALSQTAPSAQEGVREALVDDLLAWKHRARHFEKLLQNSVSAKDDARACDALLSATPSASAQEGGLVLTQAEAQELQVLLAQVRNAAKDMERENAELKAALSATPSASALGEWKPMSEAPKDRVRVLVCTQQDVRVAYESDGAWWDGHGPMYDKNNPRAWMPLPAALADTAGKEEA